MTPSRRANDKEEQQVYSTICKPAMDKVSEEITTIREKIFNGHSHSIERMEVNIKEVRNEIADIRKMITGMLIGVIGFLALVVANHVFGWGI